MDENRLFLKMTEDKYDRFLSNYAIDHGDFLSLEQQSMLMPFLRSHQKDGVFLFGGYEDAERRLTLFLPDYTGVTSEEEITDYFRTVPEDCPLAVLNVKVPPQEKAKLGHRDYLGALMGEGIKREKVGDIIVKPDGAQIIVAKELAEYLKDHYRQVGRATLNTEIVSIFDLDAGEVHKEDLRFNVASPRLDNVVSAVFGLSRKNAVEAINRGLVFVNGVENGKPDYTMKDGEKLVLRGKGKAIYRGVSGTSKKGKSYIEVTKYV